MSNRAVDPTALRRRLQSKTMRDRNPEPLPQDTTDPEVTRLLVAWSDGDERAAARVVPLVYAELKRIASQSLHRERSGHTLQPTDLVHEAYLRLLPQMGVRWRSRAHFFAMAAKMMRRILVDHARGRQRAKRGGGVPPLPLEQVGDLPLVSTSDLVPLDDALRQLAQVDRRKVAVVELHVFAGLTVEETARVLECSTATVVRDWRMAKAWLSKELQGAGST